MKASLVSPHASTSNSGVTDEKNILYATTQTMSRSDILAFFVAISLFLSSIEYLLPRPVPFFRFGLANIAILLAIRSFTCRDLFILVLLKVIGLGILSGTIASYVFLFSLFGSVGGFLAMYGVARVVKNHITFIGISIVGALGSNAIQILCAVFFVFGHNAWIIAPYLLMLGILSSCVIGIVAQYLFTQTDGITMLIHRYIQIKTNFHASTQTVNCNHAEVASLEMHHEDKKTHINVAMMKNRIATARILLLCGVLAGIAYGVVTTLTARILQVCVFFLAAHSVKKIKILYFIMLSVSIAFFYVLIPNGKILFSLGAFSLTQGAVTNGAFHALTLSGYVFLSLWCISPHITLPGRIGRLFTKTLMYFYRLWYRATMQGTGVVHDSDSRTECRFIQKFTYYINSLLESVLCLKPQDFHASSELLQSRYFKTTPWYWVVAAVLGAYAGLIIDMVL